MKIAYNVEEVKEKKRLQATLSTFRTSLLCLTAKEAVHGCSPVCQAATPKG
jgi:hypothetical protein